MGPVGNEQCRQEIKEWERGRGKGLKSAEVGRPPATCPAAEDGAGELEADGGKVTQSAPHRPPFSSVGMLFCPHCYTYRRPLPRFLSPFTHRLHFFHNEHFRHLTDALTRSDGISFTSSTAENYEQKGQGLQCRQHIMVYPVTTE